MKITLFGAGGGEVTGSAYLVESGRSKVLIDCGLFQGVPDADRRNRIPERFTFRNLDSVLLTHAHSTIRAAYPYSPSAGSQARSSAQKQRLS